MPAEMLHVGPLKGQIAGTYPSDSSSSGINEVFVFPPTAPRRVAPVWITAL